MTCFSQTLYIPQPFKDASNSECSNCAKSYGCCSKTKLSPRRNREKVREEIKEYVLVMLGAPTLKLELSSQAMDVLIDQTLSVFEDYAPREYFDYYVFNTIPGKSVYELPPDVGMVRNVFYKETATFAFSANDLGGAIPVEYFYPGGAYSSLQGGLIDPIQPIWGRMGEWGLYKAYENMYARVSSNLGGWEFVGGFRHIKLYPIPCKVQAVMVHYLQKCKDWQCATQFMKEYALALAKIVLGRIRGKIKNPFGPMGGVQLDYAELLQEGNEEKKKLEEDLITKYGDLPMITMG